MQKLIVKILFCLILFSVAGSLSQYVVAANDKADKVKAEKELKSEKETTDKEPIEKETIGD